MAGIGFRLQNLLKDDSFISRIKAYSYAAVISSGPWIYSLLSFLAVSFFVTSEAGLNRLFQVSVIYVFAFSQVIAGAFQLTATRVIADYIYESKFEMIPGVYIKTITALAPLLAIAAAVIFSSAKMGAAYTLICTLLFVLTGLIWIQLIVLTACRNFKAISYQFAIGFIISAAVSITLGTRFGLLFYLGGFTGGILYIFASMHSQILNEFRSKKAKTKPAVDIAKIKKYLPLIGVGFFFNTGVWVDKFVFWFIGGNRISGLLYENSVYDRMNLILIAMLIPVMAVFTLSVETNFYVRFRNFYKSIVEKENLDSINLNLALMKQSIIRGANSILKVALPLAFMTIVFSRQLLAALKMPPEYQLNWCVFACAALIHAFFMLSLILLMYFDFLNYTLKASALFFGVNLAVNLAGALIIGPKFMGYGYLIAVTIGFAVSLRYLNEALDNLLYHTFSRERIPGEIIIKR
ncbi:MAG: hypothetical protein A2008_03735 [Candidatus Wallbacteria bacterium GWC2_49_35]|uniref:Polysaccharide biosynthesis protein C-terminal domain-containing protein n=1 Tax=Candidatus Wallbacteria bacterium GWC2_49_35 TaxID=1817813 RepID=A0A1F7WRZ7_9BACT|nr:MAG: hypothetical protein A2008_03735 [Candidatus Wallbacteria bacterium GWC2_49_35]